MPKIQAEATNGVWCWLFGIVLLLGFLASRLG
jgi:hypothetical protein